MTSFAASTPKSRCCCDAPSTRPAGCPDKRGLCPGAAGPQNRSGRQSDAAATRSRGGRPTTRRRAAPVDTPGRGRPTPVAVLSAGGAEVLSRDRQPDAWTSAALAPRLDPNTLRCEQERSANRRRRDLHSQRDGHLWETERLPALRGDRATRVPRRCGRHHSDSARHRSASIREPGFSRRVRAGVDRIRRRETSPSAIA